MATSLLCCRCVEAKAAGVEALRASPDGRWLAVARSNGTLEIYEASTDFLKLRLSDESCSSIRSILWVPATSRAASTFQAAAAALCGASQQDEGGPSIQKKQRRRAAHGFREGRGFLSKKLRADSEEDDSEEEEEAFEEGLTTAEEYCGEEGGGSLLEWRLVTAGLHGVISEWNLRTLAIQSESPSYGGAVFALASAPYGVACSRFAAACDDGRVRLFELQGRPSKAASGKEGGKNATHFFFHDEEDEDGLEAPESDDDVGEGGGIVLLASLPKTSARLLSVCWYAPGLIFAGNAASTILRFSSSSSSATWKVADPGSGAAGGGFVADGKMVLLEAPRDQRHRPKDAGASGSSSAASVLVWSLFALPAADLLLSGDSKGCVTVWSLPTCVALRRLPLHAADVLNVEGRVTGRFASRGPGFDRDQGSPGSGKKTAGTITVVSAGVDGKLGVAVRHKDGDWVVGPTRYPHSCDIRALALLPAAAPDVSSAAGSGRTSRQPHALTFSGDGASLVAVTGAVDGSICFNERLMGLASVGRHPRPLPTHPLATGLRPRIALAQSASENFVLACSDEGLDLWHVDAPPALKNGACDTPGVVKLLHIDLRDGSQARCGDLTPDGTLIAAGSRRGLHLFGVHLKELQVVDVDGGPACEEVGDVSALRFLTNDTLVCCCACASSASGARPLFASRVQKAGRSGQRGERTKTCSAPAVSKRAQAKLERLSKDSSEDGGDSTATSSSSEDESSAHHTDRKLPLQPGGVSNPVEASLEAEWRRVFGSGAPKHKNLSRGYRLLFLDIWKGGKVLEELGPLPYPVRSFDLSLDGRLLACLFSSGSLLVVSLSDYTPLHFFASFPLLGSEICWSCFSPPSFSSSSGGTSSHICLFSSTRHYSVVPLMPRSEGEQGGEQEEQGQNEGKIEENSSGDGEAREDSGSSDGGDSDRSSDDERENKRRKKRRTHKNEAFPDSLAASSRGPSTTRNSRMEQFARQYTRPRIRQIPRSCVGPGGGSVIGALWVDSSAFSYAAAAQEPPSSSSSLYARSPLASRSSSRSGFPQGEALDNSVLLCLTPSVLSRLPLPFSENRKKRRSAGRGTERLESLVASGGAALSDEELTPSKEGRDRSGQSSDDCAGRACYGTSGSDGEDEDGHVSSALCLQSAEGLLDCSGRSGQASAAMHLHSANKLLAARRPLLSPVRRSSPPWRHSLTICPPPLYARSRLFHQNVLRFLPPSLRQLQYLRSRKELLRMLKRDRAGLVGDANRPHGRPSLLDERTERPGDQGSGANASPRTSLSTTCSSPTSWGSNSKKEGYSHVVQTDQDTQSEPNERTAETPHANEEKADEPIDRLRKEKQKDTRLSTVPSGSVSRCVVIKQSRKSGFMALGFFRSQAATRTSGARAEKKASTLHRNKTEECSIETAATRMGSLVLVEALGGAIAEPDMMPTPFNRKKYGT